MRKIIDTIKIEKPENPHNDGIRRKQEPAPKTVTPKTVYDRKKEKNKWKHNSIDEFLKNQP